MAATMKNTTSVDAHVVEGEDNVNRYSVESFQPTNAKRVPIERLDFSIYKASTNTVAFSSTEERLPLWIKAMKLRYKHDACHNATLYTQWEELEDPNEPSKCEKILINLTSKNEENVVNITVMVNKGRIQIHGKYIKEWGDDEFPTLVDLINNPDSLNSDPTKNLNNFISKVSMTKTTDIKPTTQPLSSQFPTTSLYHSPKERSLHAVKTNLAALEADFIMFQQNTEKTLSNINATLINKDKEIEDLKHEVSELKTKNVDQRKLLSDTTLKHCQLEDSIKKLNKKCKLLEEKNTMLISKIAANNERIERTELPEKSTPLLTPSIATSNQYHPLKDEAISVGPSASSHSPDPLSREKIPHSEPTSPQKIIPPSEITPPQENTPASESDLPPEMSPCAEISPPSESTPPSETVPPRHQPTEKKQAKTTAPLESQNASKINTEAQNRVITDDTVILCDSNGRYLKPSLLCPGSKSKYMRCPTLVKAKEIVENNCFSSPKLWILHAGTNDLEHFDSNKDITTAAQNVIDLIHNKHPESHIIISSILPRSDTLDDRVSHINDELEKIVSSKKNTTFVRHKNVNKNKHLKDKKHLNSVGVKFFAQNLKRAFFRKEGSNSNTDYNHKFPSQTLTRHPRIFSYTPYSKFNTSQYSNLPNQASQNSIPQRYPYPFHPPLLQPYHHQSTQPPATEFRSQNGAHSNRELPKLPSQIVQLIQDLHRYVT